MGAPATKKRRGFVIREYSDSTPAEERMAEYKASKAHIGDRRSGLVKDRLISKLGPGKYGELLKALGKDS